MKNYGQENLILRLFFADRTTIIELLNYIKVNYIYSRNGSERLTRNGKIVEFSVFQ